MFVYRLTEPIDAFDGLTPLPDWLAGPGGTYATRWALQAVLALADAASAIGWRGDMRHLPSVGVIPTPPTVTPYLVVKQDDNGATFIVTADEAPWLTNHTAGSILVPPRSIGVWTHPTTDDIPTQTAEPSDETAPAPWENGPAF
jgi:hypothetical protein